MRQLQLCLPDNKARQIETSADPAIDKFGFQ